MRAQYLDALLAGLKQQTLPFSECQIMPPNHLVFEYVPVNLPQHHPVLKLSKTTGYSIQTVSSLFNVADIIESHLWANLEANKL